MSDAKIFINGRIRTMDPDKPVVESFAIGHGLFLRVGDEALVRTFAGPGAEIVDLKGKTVLPGFIETHNHLSYYSLSRQMVDCSPLGNRNMAEVLSKIKERAQATEPGHWVLGFGYDDTFSSDSRHLTKEDLDKVAPDHLVFIGHTSGHLTYVNTKSLELGGVTAQTPQPQGGEIRKDASGEPTGLLLEHSAIMLVAAHLPSPDTEIFKAALPPAMAIYNQAGVTSIHDAAVGILNQGPATLRAYQELEASGDLTLRVYLTTMSDFYDRFLELGLLPGFGSDMLKFGSVKMFQDGSIQGLTAALSQGYHCRPDFYGELIRPQEAMDELVAKYHARDFQIAVHANGDAAIESVLKAMEKAQAQHAQPDLRHMIIHCQTATDDQIQRMKKLGVVPSYFPNHVYYWGDRHVARFLGPDRAAKIDPLGASVEAGLRFTLHADTPVTPIDPLFSIHCAVNRITRNGELLGPEQRITPHQALQAFTTDAAYCSYEENLKGSITQGKLADFVILSGDPVEVSPETIKDIKVLETVVGGRTVFST